MLAFQNKKEVDDAVYTFKHIDYNEKILLIFEVQR